MSGRRGVWGCWNILPWLAFLLQHAFMFMAGRATGAGIVLPNGAAAERYLLPAYCPLRVMTGVLRQRGCRAAAGVIPYVTHSCDSPFSIPFVR